VPAFIAALAATTLLVPLANRLARRMGAVAQPDERRIHKVPTPRLGGVALFGGWLFGLSVSLQWTPPAIGLVVGSTMVAVVMTLDDAFGLPWGLKFGWQVAVALLMALGFGLSITYLRLPLAGIVQLGALGVVLSVVWLVGMQNTINLLDGVDGLASGVVGIAAGALMMVAIRENQRESVVLSAALVGCCAGFLVWNWSPARVFMGDVGSHFLGLALGGIALISTPAKGVTVFAVVLPALAVPIADTAWAVWRRRREKRPITAPDLKHVHHLMLAAGLSQQETALVFYLISAILASLGLMIYGHRLVIGFFIACLLLAMAYIGWRWRRRRRSADGPPVETETPGS
jgi:UDP-GlcNAc:undecaprenyl-phosphate GlcNAc-1-phosphate transferase